MFSLKCKVDNVVNREGGRNSKTGEVYEPYQTAQVTYWDKVKGGDSIMERADLNIPRAWGDMKKLKGQVLDLPVSVSSMNWDLNIKIREDAPKPEIKDLNVTAESGKGNGSKQPAGVGR